jgi:hypothetical protein
VGDLSSDSLIVQLYRHFLETVPPKLLEDVPLEDPGSA